MALRLGLVVTLAAAGAALAQQPNYPVSSFVINQEAGPNPAGPPWPRLHSLALDHPFPIQVSGIINTPFVGFVGPYSPGYDINVWGMILDIDTSNPAAVTIWGNGIANPAFRTGSSGAWTIMGTGTQPPLAPGSSIAGQVAIANPFYPAGWMLTACNRITFTAPPTTQGFTVTLEDDNSVPIAFLPPHVFPFYGINRTNVFIGSNGFCSWNQGSDDFSPSVQSFLSQMPRIAMLWADLLPNTAGTVSYAEDSQQASVTFANVPGIGNGGLFNFSLAMAVTGDFTISWSFNNGSPLTSHIVGFSPGNAATGVSQDISVVLPPGATTLPGEAFFEFWAAPPAPGFDLSGLTLHATPVGATQYVVY